MIISRDEQTMKVMNKDGVVKTIAFATDAQMRYLNQLRLKLGKDPLKGKPTVYAAKKAIDSALKKIAELNAKPKQTSLI
jgi:hypothetical protein